MEGLNGKLLRGASKLAKESGESETSKMVITLLKLKLSAAEDVLMGKITPSELSSGSTEANESWQSTLDTIRYSLDHLHTKVDNFESQGDKVNTVEVYQSLMHTYKDLKNRLKTLAFQHKYSKPLLLQTGICSQLLEQLAIRINDKVRKITVTILPYAKSTAVQFYKNMMQKLTGNEYIGEPQLLKFHEIVSITAVSEFQSTLSDLMGLWGMDIFLMSRELAGDLTSLFEKIKLENQQRKDACESLMDKDTTMFAICYQDVMTQYIVRAKELPPFCSVRRKHDQMMTEVLREFTENNPQLDETNDHPAEVLINKIELCWRFVSEMYENYAKSQSKEAALKAKKEAAIVRLEETNQKERELLVRVGQPASSELAEAALNRLKSDSEDDEGVPEEQRRDRKRKKATGRRTNSDESSSSGGPGPSKREMMDDGVSPCDADEDGHADKEVAELFAKIGKVSSTSPILPLNFTPPDDFKLEEVEVPIAGSSKRSWKEPEGTHTAFASFARQELKDRVDAELDRLKLTGIFGQGVPTELPVKAGKTLLSEEPVASPTEERWKGAFLKLEGLTELVSRGFREQEMNANPPPPILPVEPTPETPPEDPEHDFVPPGAPQNEDARH